MDNQEQNITNNANNEIEQLRKQCEEYLNGWKRAKADFINYKKEEGERVAQMLNYGKMGFVMQILPILDSMDMAQNKIPEELKENPSVKGLLQVKKQLVDFLKAQGVEPFESVGGEFDPNFHDVIQAVEAEGRESGVIVEELEKGYKMGGQLLRPAKVKVAK